MNGFQINYYKNNQKIYNKFIRLFKPKKVNKSSTFENDVYSQAHDAFMENVIKIENEIPSIALEDEYWYDEFHDEITEEYCKKIIEVSK